MFLSLLLATALLGTTTAQLNYAVDIKDQASQNTFNCLKASNFRTVFVRAYKPDGTGAVDYSAISNIHLAANAQLGVEVYMKPNPMSKPAATQVDEAVSALTNAGITVRTMWIMVTSPINWSRNVDANINFVAHAIQRIRARGLRPGVYTNHNDWQQITNGQASNLGPDVMLWYWNVYAPGVGGESVPNFSDFRPFGQWQYANVKQYAQTEMICGLMLNKDVYHASGIANPIQNNATTSSAKGTSTTPASTSPSTSLTMNEKTTLNETTASTDSQQASSSSSDSANIGKVIVFFVVIFLIFACCASCLSSAANSNGAHHHVPIGDGAMPIHVYPETTIGTGAVPYERPAYPYAPIGTGAVPYPSNSNPPPPPYPDAAIGTGAMPYQGYENPMYADASIGNGAAPNQGYYDPM